VAGNLGPATMDFSAVKGKEVEQVVDKEVESEQD
jgi:hypothetical protein